MPGTKKFGFAQAARRLGLSIVPYASIKGGGAARRSVFCISDGKKELFTLGTTILSTSFIGMKIAADKATTNEILRNHNIPTTEQILIKDASDLEAFYLKHHGDILLKPLASTVGKGVYGTLPTLADALTAFWSIKKDFSYVLAEKKIRGKEYRVLIFEDQIIAIAEYIPATITGNGIDTILSLIDQHNAAVAPRADVYPIPIKPELVHILNEQGLALSTIPGKDIPIVLYHIAPISHGGSVIDVTDRIHPTNTRLFLAAARAIHLNIAGIDVIAEDIGQPIAENGGVIIEINGGPDLSLHQGTSLGGSFDAAEKILRLYFNLGK